MQDERESLTSRLKTAIKVPNQLRERDASRFGTGLGENAHGTRWFTVSAVATREQRWPTGRRKSTESSLHGGGLGLAQQRLRLSERGLVPERLEELSRLVQRLLGL